MKEFTRVAWAGTRAREVWEPRIKAINDTWLDIELLSVAEGLRPAALVFERPGFKETLRGLNLEADTVAPGRYVVVKRGTLMNNFQQAWARREDALIGDLLGFPRCCIHFFDRVWNTEKKRDTTLSMTGVDGYAECNILGRWLGVRLVPHLPCSFECRATHDFGQMLSKLWPDEEYVWAREILSWQTRYSALHGVAIVTMPVVKVITSTDYTPDEWTIDRPGNVPAEAPPGIGFPFRKPSVISLTSLKQFGKAVQAAGGV